MSAKTNAPESDKRCLAVESRAVSAFGAGLAGAVCDGDGCGAPMRPGSPDFAAGAMAAAPGCDVPTRPPMTRRRFLALTAVALAAASATLAGCSNGSSSDGSSGRAQGFASDTEVAGEAVTVYIVADENLKRALPGSDTGRVEDYFKRYQEQAGREQVTFAIKYKPAAELANLAKSGFDEGTGVIALDQTVEAACGASALYGGAANTSIRAFTAQLGEKLIVVRRAGSSVEMPKSDTLSGDDSADGQISRMQHLVDFDGKIAIAADTLTEGMLANRVLARWGYYSDESGRGGKYSKEIASKIVVCNTIDKLVDVLVKDKCQLAFATQSMLWGDYDGIEEVYQPAYGNISYSGASVPDAENAAVARDFFEFITRCV